MPIAQCPLYPVPQSLTQCPSSSVLACPMPQCLNQCPNATQYKVCALGKLSKVVGSIVDFSLDSIADSTVGSPADCGLLEDCLGTAWDSLGIAWGLLGH